MSKDKETYASPLSEVLELRLEGVIAASGGNTPQQYDNPFGTEQSF